MRRALCLLLPLLLLALPALAEPLFGEELCLLLPTLTASQRALYDALYDALLAGQEEIVFSSPVAYDDVEPVLDLLALDTPELCAMGQTWSVSYVRTHPEEATGLTTRRILPSGAEEELLAAARALTEDLPADPFDRLDALHERLCAQIVYDVSGTSPHSAWGALVEGRAVCEGYAKAFTLLCRLAGIPCSVAEGEALAEDGVWGSHSWCVAVPQGAAVAVDPTWDDQDGVLLTDWLGLTDAQLADTHHRRSTAPGLPACDTEGLDWHSRHGLAFASADEAWSRYAAMASGEVLRLRFPDSDALEAFLARLREHPVCACSFYAGTGQPCVTLIGE